MPEGLEFCRLCDKNVRASRRLDDFNYYIDCGLCGEYIMKEEFYEDFPGLRVRNPDDVRWLINATRQSSIARKRKPIVLSEDNYRDYIEEHKRTSVAENAERLLKYISDKCPRPGDSMILDESVDYPVIDVLSPGELMFYKIHLSETGLIKTNGRNVSLTTKGIQALMGPQGGGFEAGRCFVAMSFSDEMKSAYIHGLKPAIVDSGYMPICMTEVSSNDDINYQIIVELRKAELIVADFTELKAGVYFEAGFGLALRKEVFWTCRADHIGELHFDTNHYSHIVWNTVEDLKSELKKKILAVSGPGPYARRKATN